MANNLKKELKGKYVVLGKAYTGSPIEKVFLCKDGFGCSSNTYGNAIFGEFVIDGEKCRVEGYEVERLATKEEIKQAKQIFSNKNKIVGTRRAIILQDKDNKEKTIEIGDPFLPDGTFWVTIRIGKEVVSPSVKLPTEQVIKLFNFLNTFRNSK